MRPLLPIGILFSALVNLHAQCLTDFTKLAPTPTTDYSTGFGQSIDMFDDYLAVGMPGHDSLGRFAGLVYIYKKTDVTWQKVATITPTDPYDGSRFGFNVTLSRNYLLVSSYGNGGKVYLYKKPASGWTSQSESTSFRITGSGSFGCNWNSVTPMAISEDEQVIAIADMHAPITPTSTSSYYLGAIYVYRKSLFQEWTGTIQPQRIIAPAENLADFGRFGVALHDNYLITGTPFTGFGSIYIYPISDAIPRMPVATLRPFNSESFLLGQFKFTVNDEGLFIPGFRHLAGVAEPGILFYKKPSSGIWADANATCLIPLSNTIQSNAIELARSIAVRGDSLLATFVTKTNESHLVLITRGADGWCQPSLQNLEIFTSAAPLSANPFGHALVSNENTDFVISLISSQDQNSGKPSLKTFSKQGNHWRKSSISNEKTSTSSHFFGARVVGYDNHLFVSAPEDGTRLQGVGAVYYFEKTGTQWNLRNKLLAPSISLHDDGFGSAIATNRHQLAIGASSFETGKKAWGRVFIYEKSADGWANAKLTQEIALPEDSLTVYAYGDNLAMDKDWLVIPYVQNSPYAIMLAIYKFDGRQWNFFQNLLGGYGDFFSKTQTLAVALESDILLCGSWLFQRNTNGKWEKRHELIPSDPEYIQVSPDFTRLVSNGSNFGYANAIHNNTIFISAPTRDYDGVWDVGAVYVYTKKPRESWSSRTESVKLVPRIKSERELFGISLRAYANTLIVGTPGADFNLDGLTARNKPGRVYVYQAKDYLWETAEWLQDLTGDKFQKDYFGISVYADESDFFIGASIEDLSSGRLSGSVYITPPPPMIRLVPPTCTNAAPFKLFGYPFGGEWFGPGITNSSEGIFDPKSAGAGTHEIRYQTPSCANVGVLRIVVKYPPHARLISPLSIAVCRGRNISVALAAEPEEDVFYQWLFRADSSQSFLPIPLRTSREMMATQRGQYRVRVMNDACDTFSEIITIVDEVPNFEAVPIRGCEGVATPVLLPSTPNGQWSGPGISNNRFIATGLVAATYEALYRYTSPLGCFYEVKVPITVIRAPLPVITRSQQNICEAGSILLQIQNTSSDTNYSWEASHNGNITSVNETGASVRVYENGRYTVTADYGPCKVKSNPFVVDDSFTASLLPAETYTELCGAEELLLQVTNPSNASYKWVYRSSEKGSREELPGNASSLVVRNSGFYQVIVTLGSCVYSSSLKQVFIYPSDSVLVPNVFTPNGDGINERLIPLTEAYQGTILVMDRYGKTVYEGPANEGWNGDRAATGTYYFLLTFSSCRGERKTVKGYVQLVR